jgi:hypothetical protein
MRFSLIDLLLFIAFAGITSAIGTGLALSLAPHIPIPITIIATWLIGIFAYLATACPLYRKFRWKPLLLPRCPCCNKRQEGFHFIPAWPRVIYKCPSCNGEFVIWHNGQIADSETWDKPVLTLSWPYVFGRYKKETKPEPTSAGDIANRAVPEN